MTAYRTKHLDTPAGTYTVELHTDQGSENPLTSWDQTGLAFYIVGNRDSVLLDTLNDAEGANNALRTWINAWHDVEEIERRYAKWKAITGNPWVLVTGHDFDSYQSWGWMVLVDTSLTYVASDGNSYPALPQPEQTARSTMAVYRTWAAGEVCGFVVKAPNGDDVESVWSFYDDDDALAEGTAAAMFNASQRVTASGLVGAGFVGII